MCLWSNCDALIYNHNEGKQTMVEFVKYTSILGNITIAIEDDTLIGLWFDGQKYDRANIQGEFSASISTMAKETIDWLNEYFSGKNPEMTLKISPRGTIFQQAVWECLLKVPYGETRTYSDIKKLVCRKLGKISMSNQAIGTAIGHNPISIIIPCHRVIGKDGSLHGYAGGIERKQWLLQHEKTNASYSERILKKVLE